MSILVNKETKLLVQGITGKEGQFHARACVDYGTQVVAGVTPGKGGQQFEGQVPIFHTVADAVKVPIVPLQKEDLSFHLILVHLKMLLDSIGFL